MANLMDLIREIQGIQNQTTPVGGGFAPSAQERILNEEQIEAGNVVNDSGVYEPGIQVEGTVSRPAPVDQSQYLLSESGAPDLNNTAWAQAAVEARNRNDKEVEHKGMFGVKGTLRNVLGVLGDAFLVQGGANPVYAPTRQREREGDAMAGYTQSPRGAAERMTAINPEFAQEMGEKIATQEIARANAERLAAAELAARRAKGIGIVGAMMGADGLEDAATYDRMKPIIQNTIKAYGLEDTFSVPDVYDPNFAATIANASMSPYQQEQDENNDERTELTRERTQASIAQGNARVQQGERRTNAYVERAKRPPAGRAPRAETADEMEIRIGNKDKPTAGEKAWLERRRSGSKSSGGKPRRPVNPAGTSRFR